MMKPFRTDRVETAIRAGQSWKAMDANARRRWDELAKGAKEDYDEAVRLFEAQGGRMHDVTPTNRYRPTCYPAFRAKHQAQKPDEKVTILRRSPVPNGRPCRIRTSSPFTKAQKNSGTCTITKLRSAPSPVIN